MMRKFPLYSLGFVLLLFVQACSSQKELSQWALDADTAYDSGDHREALRSYELLIEGQSAGNGSPEAVFYQRAGLSAHALGKTNKAVHYLEIARHTPAADHLTYAALAKSYRELDNLSREITNLERYLEKSPEAPGIDAMRERLFETYVESRNWEQALGLWPQLAGDPSGNEELLEAYFHIKTALEKEGEATAVAEQLLVLNRANRVALDHLAKKHFRQADQRYCREMEAYEENRTHRQYAQLLQALEVVNTDLHIALDYFERLYQSNPSAEYATYLANIHERFQNEERARYYRRQAGD